MTMPSQDHPERLPVSPPPVRNTISGDSYADTARAILRYPLIPHHKPAYQLSFQQRQNTQGLQTDCLVAQSFQSAFLNQCTLGGVLQGPKA